MSQILTYKTFFTYHDNYTVRQNAEDSSYSVFCEEQRLNRSFDSLSECVIYCMGIAHKLNNNRAQAIAEMVQTYFDNIYNK